MFPFLSPRFRSLLIGAGMLTGLMNFAQGAAFAQTRTAELDRIQAPAQALPAPEQRVALVMGNSKYESTTPLSLILGIIFSTGNGEPEGDRNGQPRRGDECVREFMEEKPHAHL